MKTNNVWNEKEQANDDIFKGIYDEDYAQEDSISVYEAAFLEAYNKEQSTEP